LQETILATVWDLIASILNRSTFQALILIILVAAGLALPIILKKRKSEPSSEQPVETSPEGRVEDLPPPPQVEPFNPPTINDIPRGGNPPEEQA
jgi:hypothetical protein